MPIVEFVRMSQLNHNYYQNPYASEIFAGFDHQVDQVSYYLPGSSQQFALKRGEVQSATWGDGTISQRWIEVWGVDGIEVTYAAS